MTNKPQSYSGEELLFEVGDVLTDVNYPGSILKVLDYDYEYTDYVYNYVVDIISYGTNTLWAKVLSENPGTRAQVTLETAHRDLKKITDTTILILYGKSYWYIILSCSELRIGER